MKKHGLLWVLIAGFVILVIIYSVTYAADLKCVTIKFKNDSELKLKTQWFVNGCDTTKNIVWEGHRYWDSLGVPDDLAELERQGLEYEWIDQGIGWIRWQQIRLTITCRTLLFPPDVRREPVINPASGEEAFFADAMYWLSIYDPGELIKRGRADPRYGIDYDWKADTTEGEALLWYEEVKWTSP